MKNLKLNDVVSQSIRYSIIDAEKLTNILTKRVGLYYLISMNKLYKLFDKHISDKVDTLLQAQILNRIEEQKTLKEHFLLLKNGKDLAEFLKVSYPGLLLTLNILPGQKTELKKQKYTEFEIPKKSGGSRLICAPNAQLLSLQKSLNYILNLFYVPPKSAHGFILTNNNTEPKSIVSNAKKHKNRKIILNIDLKDFFPSITGRRIFKFFMSKPFNFNSKVAGLLTEICTHKKNILDKDSFIPQGAATSPTLSNMICLRLDSSLQKLASEKQIVYTRYADDITFSSSRNIFPENFLNEVIDIIAKEGFSINEKKTREQTNKVRQEVTGLIVNKKANVQRKYIRNVRAMLNNLEQKGLKHCQEKLDDVYKDKLNGKAPNFKKVLLGKIDFIGNVRGKNKLEDPQELYSKFIEKYFFLLPKQKSLTNQNTSDKNINLQTGLDFLDE